MQHSHSKLFVIIAMALMMITFSGCDINIELPAEVPNEKPIDPEDEEAKEIEDPENGEENEDPENSEENEDPENSEENEDPENGEENEDPENGEENEDPENGEENEDPEKGSEEEDNNDNGDSDTPTDVTEPDADTSISRWTGLWATDAGRDVVGNNSDFFHELNTFDNIVTVRFNGSSAVVEKSNSSINTHIDGAYVTLDMQSNSVSGVKVVVSGSTSDGSLKVYSDKKYMLMLNGVDITSKRGCAINSQAKKRVFLHLGSGTTNRLSDASTYASDSYTLAGSVNEDRKGALFAEGHIILSGQGALVVRGKQRHAIATDGYYYQRPGTTVAVLESQKNGIHIKGDDDDNIGAQICGGAISANIASTAGKGIKCELGIVIEGGQMDITTTGNAYYDSEEADTSSAAGIKSDTNIHIKNGSLNLKSSGSGGKGITCDNSLTIDDGDITISTTGKRYSYTSQLTSSPKGIKADGDIYINGGKIDISVTGTGDGCEGFESKKTITINGGDIIVASYDDGINAASAITINGGRIYAHGSNNDGIDSNGTIVVNDGLVIGVGGTAPETGIDVDRNDQWKIYGGTVIGFGGSMMASPGSSSTQCMVIYNGLSATMGTALALLDSDSNPILTFEYPKTHNNATILVSTPELRTSNSYTFASGGSISNASDYWQGWYDGGVWSGGSTLTTFTQSSTIQTIGSSSGSGPGGGGGPGGPGGPGGGGGGWPW